MPLKMVLKVSEIWGFPTCGPLCLGWMNFNRLLGWIHIRLQGWINNLGSLIGFTSGSGSWIHNSNQGLIHMGVSC